jgi:hypothetical protein
MTKKNPNDAAEEQDYVVYRLTYIPSHRRIHAFRAQHASMRHVRARPAFTVPCCSGKLGFGLILMRMRYRVYILHVIFWLRSGCAVYSKPKNLRYYFALNVRNDDTISVISKILK